MAVPTYIDPVDTVTDATIGDLLTLTAPVVSLILPTHRNPPNLTHDGLVLRGLIDEADRALLRAGIDSAEAARILAPAQELVEDRPFWAEQGDGLAVYADADRHVILRVALETPARCQVGDVAHLVPLIPLLTGGQTFAVLVVSVNRVRLFEATRSAIHELDLGPIPASLQDMERRSSREPQLQHQHEPAVGGAVATFHGHGGTDVAEIALAHFLREVADGVRARLGASYGHPVLLASVAEYLPLLARTGQIPTLLPDVLAGNHDATPPHELLAAAWPLIQAGTAAAEQDWRERAAQALGTGSALTDIEAVGAAAAQGRIGALLLDPEAPADAATDRAVAAVVATGGRLYDVPALPDGAPAVALLRY